MEIKDWTYDELPEFTDEVPGALHVTSNENYVGVVGEHTVTYATRDGMDLHLLIYTPWSRASKLAPERGQIAPTYPCIVFVQGSAWRPQNLNQSAPGLCELAKRGFVVAIVEYRPAVVAGFPAQIEDTQAAVRFMTEHAAEYHVDTDKLILAGNSSGGHTAVFGSFWPQENGEPATALNLKGVIDLYGAVSFMHKDGFPNTLNTGTAESPEGLLMRGALDEHPELAKLGTAVEHINADTELPPMLIVHGTKDRRVNATLSVELYQHLKATGHDTELVLLDGAEHGRSDFYMPEMLDIYERFIRRCVN